MGRRGWQILARQAECAPSVAKVKTRMWEESVRPLSKILGPPLGNSGKPTQE